MDSHPAAEFSLGYETVGTLMLRRVLDPNNPRHKAIIDEYSGGGRGALAALLSKRLKTCSHHEICIFLAALRREFSHFLQSPSPV